MKWKPEESFDFYIERVNPASVVDKHKLQRLSQKLTAQWIIRWVLEKSWVIRVLGAGQQWQIGGNWALEGLWWLDWQTPDDSSEKERHISSFNHSYFFVYSSTHLFHKKRLNLFVQSSMLGPLIVEARVTPFPLLGTLQFKRGCVVINRMHYNRLMELKRKHSFLCRRS